MSVRVRIGKKYQVTVPQRFASEIGWSVGEERYVQVHDGRLHIDPVENRIAHRVRLRERNQITVPIEICRSLGIAETGFVELHSTSGSLIITPHLVTISGLERQLPARSERADASNEFRPLEQLERLAKRSRRTIAKRRKS